MLNWQRSRRWEKVRNRRGDDKSVREREETILGEEGELH